MGDIFHTRIGPALREGSTWSAIGVGITAAAALPSPLCYIVAFAAVMGAILRDPGHA